MKKNYSKPEIVFESFKLSTSIAGNCAEGFQTNSSTLESCEYNHNGMIIFGSTNNDCVTFKHDEETCYQVPVEGVTLFNS